MPPTTVAEQASLPSPSPRARRALGALLFGTLGVLGLVALGHAAPLRPLMGRLFGASAPGCPVKGMSAEALEKQRVQASAALAGAVPAKRRVAGPFVIGETKRGDVEAWASRTSLTCTPALAGAALRCADVPSAALAAAVEGAPAGEDVFARFAPSGVLVGLDVMRAPTSGAHAAALLTWLRERALNEVGSPTAAPAALSAASLDAPGIQMISTEYRFSDYAVDLGVSRLVPKGPLVVREQYRAVN